MATATLPEPPIAGYPSDHAADLADARNRERLSAPALKAFVRIAESWNLTEKQSRALLGDIASSTYHAWRNAPQKQRLSQDTLLRISLVLGIYKALRTYFGDELADRWITLGNRGSLFGGMSPLEYMIRHGQPGMLQVRRVLDAWREGH